jgi:hypothetical protein
MIVKKSKPPRIYAGSEAVFNLPFISARSNPLTLTRRSEGMKNQKVKNQKEGLTRIMKRFVQ